MSVNIVHSDGSLEKIAGMGFGGGVPSGGTTGQVLTKKSDTDYDIKWADTPRYNVLDYGLVGDGVTDNTEALQDMVDNIPEESVVYFPQGRYVISDTIEIGKALAFIGDTTNIGGFNFDTDRVPESIIIYSGEAANKTMFVRTIWREVSFKGLTFKCDSFRVSYNSNRPDTYPRPMFRDVVRKEGISAIDMHAPDAFVSITDCRFFGFSGFAVRIGQHKYVQNCSFYNCYDAIQAGLDSIIQNCWICHCHNGIKSALTDAQEKGTESLFASIMGSDIWADQLSGHFYMSEINGVATCLFDNLCVDLVDEAAFYVTHFFQAGRIDGYINRYGAACEGIESANITEELLPKSCCFYSWGFNKDLKLNVITKPLNDGRKLIACVNGQGLIRGVNISCENLMLADIFGAHCSVLSSSDKTLRVNVTSREGACYKYRDFWYINGVTEYSWGPLHNMFAPEPGVYCKKTNDNTWWMSTAPDDREAWIKVGADMLASVYDPNGAVAEAGGIEAYVETHGGSEDLFMYIAHRGVTNDGEYDNTVKAIQNAVDCGYEWCEIDVVPTADGNLVLSHGRSVTLYDNGASVTISDLCEETYDDLKNYTWDAAGVYPIDTLDKVLFTFKHQNINFLLDCASVTRNNVISVFEKIADYGMRDRCILGAQSSVLYPYFIVDRINKDFSDVVIRLTYMNDSSYKYVIENLKNPMYLDAHYSSGLDVQPMMLSYRKPILVYGFYKHNRSAADEADMQKWVNFAAGVMAKYSEDLDDLKQSVKFDFAYSDINMDTSIINLTDDHPTRSLSAANESEGAGYINMYMTDYDMGNITNMTIGETTTGTLTMKENAPAGTMEIRAFNGSCEKIVPVNVAKNNLIPIVGDHNPDTHKYAPNGQKITWFSLYGTVADGKTIVNSDRYMYSKEGFLGEFYEAPIPTGATQLDVVVDTTKVEGGKTYVSIFDADGTRVVQDNWSATHSIPILDTYKTFVVNAIYDSTRPAFIDNTGNFGYRTNSKYDEIVDAVSISFTTS